jgi:glycosyltransferase involved in cell wall biosynthesis
MKVLMTTDTIGGVWTYAVELAAALQAQGARVVLCTLGGGLSDSQRAVVNALGLTVYQSQYRLEWMDDPWGEVALSGRWLLHLARQERPDVVHINGYAHAALPWRAPVLVVAHSCVLTWWRAVHHEDAPAKYDRYRREVTRGLAAADLVVAPTQAMLKAMQSCYGGLERTRVIHNGRTPPDGLGVDKQPFVLTAGRLWDEAKNLATLDQAADGLSWPVFAAGSNLHPNGEQVRPQHLQCLGHRNLRRMQEDLARAAVFCLPARYEPFGLSVLEAACHGCALVLGDIPTLRELWDGVAAFVPPDDPHALRERLEALIADPDRRQRMGAAAQQRSQAFTMERMATHYHAVYDDLIRRAPSSGRRTASVPHDPIGLRHRHEPGLL